MHNLPFATENVSNSVWVSFWVQQLNGRINIWRFDQMLKIIPFLYSLCSYLRIKILKKITTCKSTTDNTGTLTHVST